MNDLKVGIAGEHIAMADIMLMGYKVHQADQTRPYDFVVDVGDKLIRVQVKTTATCKPIPQRSEPKFGYIWHVKRAKSRYGNKERYYADSEYDVLALVSLEEKRVAYLPNGKKVKIFIIQSPPVKNSNNSFDALTFERALKNGENG